jgi:hypothetical protein
VIRLGGRSLARANALANALALARDLASDLDNAEVLVGTLALARANALARALANASALNRDRALDLDRALHRARDLALALTSALNLDRARALDHDHDRHRARDLALALVGDLVDLDPAAHWARAVVADGVWSMPGRVPRGLVGLAVGLLPAPQRPRYRAEFHVELVELPCRERLGYSVRVLAGAWKLRRVLVEAVRTPDGAAPRRAER